jgi:hypothetical protein
MLAAFLHLDKTHKRACTQDGLKTLVTVLHLLFRIGNGIWVLEIENKTASDDEEEEHDQP